jgi:hypothetical protein
MKMRVTPLKTVLYEINEVLRSPLILFLIDTKLF